MNKTIKEQLLAEIPPKPGEVWLIKTKNLVMHDRNADPNKNRPLLILSTNELIEKERSMINVIPLSRKPRYDAITFPVGNAFEEIDMGFKPSDLSSAVIVLFQPILREFLLKRCARLEQCCYEAIKTILVERVIGQPFSNFDLDV